MSFGYGVGDFLAVSKLAWTVYNVYKDAPGDFKHISDEIKSLHIIVEGQRHDFKDRNLLPEEQKGLGEILQGCENVLKDLDELMVRYRGLGVGGNPRIIDRLKWDPENVVNLRARLTSNTNLLSTFLASCQHKENQRSLATIQELLKHGINRRNSTASIRSFASFASSRSAKAAWKQFCRNLNSAGVTADILQGRGDEILRMLMSSPAILEEEVVGDTAAQPTEPPEDGTELEQSSSDSRGKKNNTIPTISWGPLNRIVGRRLLHEAATSGDHIAVKAWLQVIRDLNYKLDGKTALHIAASNGHLDVVKLLLEKGANIEATRSDYGHTALFSAAKNGYAGVVELLLENGANTEATHNQYGDTALTSAALHGHLDVVKLLLENGANTEATDNQFGGIALHSAAFHGHLGVVKLLLGKGANIEATRSDYGHTALFSAANNGYAGVVKLLLENGANTEATHNQYGDTALHVAAFHGHLDVVKLLLEKGADIETTTSSDGNGSTPLDTAAERGHPDIVKLLLEKGANIEAKNTFKCTPLDSAISSRIRGKFLFEARDIQKKRSEVIELLRNAGTIHS